MCVTVKKESLVEQSALTCAHCCECHPLTFIVTLAIDRYTNLFWQKNMDGRSGLFQDPAFVKLKDYFDQHGESLNIANMFKEDSQRFSKFR